MNAQGRLLLAATLAVASMVFVSHQLWREASSAVAPAGTVLVRVQKLTGLDADNREQVLYQSERGMLVPLRSRADRHPPGRQAAAYSRWRVSRPEDRTGQWLSRVRRGGQTHPHAVQAQGRCHGAAHVGLAPGGKRHGAPARARSIRCTRPQAGASIPWPGMTTPVKGASSSANCAGTTPSSTRPNETGRLVGRSWRSRVRWR